MYPKDDVTGENCFFTGISFGGDSTFSSAKDTVTLDCWDYISLLEELMYINSPFFDGMSLHYAIAYILERSGVSVLSAIDNNPHLYIEEGFEETIKNYVLPTSNRFLSPLKKFKEGTKLIEALKDFINIFWVTFKCDNKGSYVLGTWEGLAGASPKDTRFAQTNDIGGTIVTKNKEFVTFVPEGDSSYKYNVLYDKKVISPKVKQWFNVFCVKTVERYTNIPEIVTDGFRDSITGIGGNAANGIPDNFIGYMKLYFTQESSLGGAQSAREMIHTVKNVIGQTRTWCTIRIVGRRGLELLDIIKIDNNYYRIMELRGSVSSTPNPVWWMDVVAENIGYFNNDVDTSDINMYPNQ
jgi:hypothetical protein